MTDELNELLEKIARIIDPEGFARRAYWLAASDEWAAKSIKFGAEEDADKYPYGQVSVDRIVKAWSEQAEKTRALADASVSDALAKARQIVPTHLSELQALRAENDRLRGAGLFLLDRMNDFDWSILDDESSRDFHGHVLPAMQRLRAAINETEDRPEASSPVSAATGISETTLVIEEVKG